MIWLVFAAMAAATILSLLLPLMRRRAAVPPSRAAYDLTVYKDQLAEVGREVERGTLTADQADAARTEIQRRILALGEGPAPASGRRSRFLATLTVVLVVPLVGFGVYMLLGSPNLPDQPYSARADKIAKMKDQAVMIRAMVDQLSARLEKEPNDGKGWAMLGRSLRVTGEEEKALDAYKKAVTLLPGDVQVRLEYGAMLLAQVPQGNPLPAEFVQLMREVVGVDPNNADALYFLGLDAAQNGNLAKARDLWTRLAAILPEGSEDRAEVQKQIDALK